MAAITHCFGSSTTLDTCEPQNGICKNGGTCFATQSDQTCICSSGYTGKFCDAFTADVLHLKASSLDLRSDPISSSSATVPNKRTEYLLCSPDIAILCKNGATCSIIDEELVCSCMGGYSGYYCEIKMDNITLPETEPINLVDSNQTYSMCSSEYEGVCLNGGTCFIIDEK